MWSNPVPRYSSREMLIEWFFPLAFLAMRCMQKDAVQLRFWPGAAHSGHVSMQCYQRKLAALKACNWEAQRVLSLAHHQMNSIESNDKQREQLAVECLASEHPS